MSNSENIVKKFFKDAARSTKTTEFIGFLGNHEGTIKADKFSNVWVILLNGSVVKARNKVAPLTPRTPVAVGYSKDDPKLLQVLRVLNVYDKPIQPYIPPHSDTQTWPGADTLPVRPEQFLPGLALPSDPMVVQFYGWFYKIAGVWYVARSQSFDFTSYVPASGALWVSVEIDAAGDITYVESDPVDSRDFLTLDLIPDTPSTRALLFSVKCYAGQTEVIKTKNDTDIFDPRFSMPVSSSVAWGNITGDIEDQTDLVAYVESLLTGLWDDRGNFDASGGAYPSSGGSGAGGAIKKGDIWTVSVAGTLPTGRVVEVGDIVRALVDSPGSTEANWAIGQNNIGYVAENSANKTDAMAGNTASSTKYLSAKGVYDWAVATFQAALGYTAENSANKTDAMSGNTSSSTKYLSAKGVYDWAVATFQAISTALSQIAGLTPSDDDILQRKSGAWTSRTIAQYKTDLALNWELIEDKQLGSDTASFDFTSISANYKHLKLLASVRSTRSTGLTTTDKVMLKFNNDTGSNYVARVQYNGGSDEQNTAGGVYHVSYIDASGSPSNWYSNFEMTLFDYANTNTYKTWQSRGMQATTTGASQFYIYDAMGIYLSTSAISRITLYPNAGPNFKQYSRVTLFGAR